MFDITIVGAGPAGSNLARLLAQQTQLKICLIDKRNLQDPEPGSRRKACGGLLSPDAQKLLASQGLTIPVSILEDPQLFSVRTIDFDNRLDNHYQRHYLNMNREKFDRFLFHLVPNWVDKRQGVVYDVKKLETHWTLQLRGHSPDHMQAPDPSSDKSANSTLVTSIQTKTIIAADGANSFLRRRFAPNAARPKQYISLQKWYPLHDSMPYYTGIFDSSVTDYYSWTIQKDDQLILGTAIPVGDPVHERFEILRQKVEAHLQVPLREASRTEGAFIERITHVHQLLWEQDGIFFAGEAAGAASPTSAEGFSYCLQSSFYLAQALSGKSKNPARAYARSCRKIGRKLLAKQVKSPAMYHLGVRKWVMKSKISAIDMMSSQGLAKEDGKP